MKSKLNRDRRLEVNRELRLGVDVIKCFDTAEAKAYWLYSKAFDKVFDLVPAEKGYIAVYASR